VIVVVGFLDPHYLEVGEVEDVGGHEFLFRYSAT
jgi:hypothetical protein